MDHVPAEEADAAAGNGAADRVRVVVVIDREIAVLVEVERAGGERVVEAARNGFSMFGYLGLRRDHLIR